MLPTRRTLRGLVAILVMASCQDDSLSPSKAQDVVSATPLSESIAAMVRVSSVEELYEAVNDPANAGARIELAPMVYSLDPSRPNGGRLELQRDMELSGQPDAASRTVIDASALPATSYTVPGGQTGAIRVGRGSNAVDWLTVRDAAAGLAAIEADLGDAGTSYLRVAHCVITGNRHGIDLRNTGPASAFHVLTADIEFNQISGNTLGIGQGVRIVNQNGATYARIVVSFLGNTVVDNLAGAFVGNNNTSHSTIEVSTRADHFDGNGIGIGLAAGISTGAGFANDNVLVFHAHSTSFQGNTGPVPPSPAPPPAGITVEGGTSSLAGHASSNTLTAEFWAPTLGDNQEYDVHAWGARSTDTAPAGTNNHVTLVFHGTSTSAVLFPEASVPADPGGTNTVTIER
jgi:hypothetical protein